MSVLKLQVVSARPDDYLESNFQVAGGGRAIAERLKQYLERVYTGNESAAGTSAPPSINIVVQGNEVQASGTFTCVSVIATDAVKINGVTFTCVASGATGNQFNVGLSNTATAASMAAAINASVTALVAGYVTATSALGVVTITSAFYGLAGNQTLIESLDSTITASGVALTGGAADAGALTLNF
jgi:phage tail sheath gpL-like